MKLKMKDILAILLAILASAGIFGMLVGEGSIVPASDNGEMLEGLKMYLTGFGWICLLVGAAYVLTGYRDRVETDLLHPDEEEQS